MSNKILLHKDQYTIDNEINSMNNAISHFNEFYERYKALNLPQMETKDLPEFLNNPKTFFVKILAEGKTLKIGKLELDPSKVYDLFPLPEGTNELVEDIEKMMGDNSMVNSYRYGIQYISIYENGLIINPDHVEYITNKNTYYTETTDQMNALEIANRIAKDLTDLKALQKKAFRNPREWVNELFREKNTNGKIDYSTNLMEIRRY